MTWHANLQVLFRENIPGKKNEGAEVCENNCSVDCAANADALLMCDKRDRAGSAICANFQKRLGGVNDVN